MFQLLSKIFHLFILFLTQGLHCCMGFSLVAVIKGCSQIVVHRFLTTVVSLVVECELQGTRAPAEVRVSVVPFQSTGSAAVAQA